LSEDDEEFTIISEPAFVASASVPCWKWHSNIEVICIYCESGIASGEPLVQFSISNVWAMDSGLAQQLEPWRTFRTFNYPQLFIYFQWIANNYCKRFSKMRYG
jgi:hypothetical protein